MSVNSKLIKCYRPTRKQTVKRLKAKTVTGKIGSIELNNCVTEKSRELFEEKTIGLIIDSAFTTNHPRRSGLAWRSTVSSLRVSSFVVNEAVERVVKLVTTYSWILPRH